MTSKRCGMSAVDRISELPEAIITEILNLLPTKNAVATSILSKSWRVRWKEVTTFDMEVAWYHRNTCGMKQFVDNFASIRSFRLWWDASYSQEHLIRSAISAIPRAVKVLDLVNNSDTHAMYELPAEIFSSEDLEFMRLDGQFEIKLPDVVCLPKLAELELINWVCKQTSTETISELISNCPVLQSLTIRLKQFEDKILAISSFSLKRLHISCYDLCNEKEYRIDASALEYLFLYSSSKDISIHDSTLSSVNEVDLDVTYDSIVGLLESFHGVKSMKISCSVMCFLTIDIKKLSKSFERLTKLVVDCFFEHHVVVDLIDRCVNLKLLQINFGEVNSASSSLGCSSAVIPGCLSSSLQTLGVKFKLCPDCEVDLTVIEFILNHSSVLERVNLSFESRFEEKDDFLAFQKVDEILEKVLMMPKASPTCKLALTLW